MAFGKKALKFVLGLAMTPFAVVFVMFRWRTLGGARRQVIKRHLAALDEMLVNRARLPTFMMDVAAWTSVFDDRVAATRWLMDREAGGVGGLSAKLDGLLLQRQCMDEHCKELAANAKREQAKDIWIGQEGPPPWPRKGADTVH